MKKIVLISGFVLSVVSHAQQASSLIILDTRDVNSPPSAYNHETKVEFKLRDILQAPGAGMYSGLLTIAPWFDNSGNKRHQLNFNDGGIFYRNGLSSAGQWGNWAQLLIVNSAGNVGIGTVAPVSKLDLGNNFSDPSSFPNKVTLWSQGANNYFGFGISEGSLDYFSQGKHRFFVGYNGSPGIEVLTLKANGNAALQGKFEAKEIKVTLTPTADFVFAEDYALPKLEDIEKYIKAKKHLPEIASAKEMEKEGVNVGEFQIKLLQKIEELTLYTIEQSKQLKLHAEEIKVLKDQIKNNRL